MTSVVRWLGGLVFSCLFIWLVGAVFVDSAEPRIYDRELDNYVHAPGTVKHRSEGWGNTTFGGHGMVAGQDELAGSGAGIVVVWGDSHVEALQVDDADKACNVYNRLSESSMPQAVAMADSGYGVADYLRLIPLAERLFPNIRAHVIVLSGLDDVMPVPEPDSGATPALADDLMRHKPAWISLKFSEVARDWNLSSFVSIYRSIKSHSAGAGQADKEAFDSVARRGHDVDWLAASWRQILSQARAATSRPIAFMHVPHGPVLRNGEFDYSDVDEFALSLFKDTCAKNNMEFIDLTGDFYLFCKTAKKFPRGFFNSPPGTGHLNANGQRMIAEGLFEYFDKGAQ